MTYSIIYTVFVSYDGFLYKLTKTKNLLVVRAYTNICSRRRFSAERPFSCCSVRSRGFCIPYIQFRWGTKGRRVRSVPSSVSIILYVWQQHVIMWRVGVNAVFCVIFTLYCYYYQLYYFIQEDIKTVAVAFLRAEKRLDDRNACVRV